jgi:hypothetical protein
VNNSDWNGKEILKSQSGSLTLPDKYQRYKMLGNGWVIDIIARIYKFIGDSHE